MTEARPFGSVESLAETADRTWRALSKKDWLEAFASHPAIGASEQVAGTGFNLHPPPNSAGTGFNLHPPPNSVSTWSRQEQSGTEGADVETRAGLALLNREYAERFGHVFLVCATGKSAAEMLALGRQRLHNDPATELAIAAEEQRKITRLRLEKLLSPIER
jgi:OHCU decarboxylase